MSLVKWCGLIGYVLLIWLVTICYFSPTNIFPIVLAALAGIICAITLWASGAEGRYIIPAVISIVTGVMAFVVTAAGICIFISLFQVAADGEISFHLDKVQVFSDAGNIVFTLLLAIGLIWVPEGLRRWVLKE